MAEIFRLSPLTPKELLCDIAEREGDSLVSVVVVVRDNKDEIAVFSCGGTGAITRAGMCAYAQSVMINSLEIVD